MIRTTRASALGFFLVGVLAAGCSNENLTPLFNRPFEPVTGAAATATPAAAATTVAATTAPTTAASAAAVATAAATSSAAATTAPTTAPTTAATATPTPAATATPVASAAIVLNPASILLSGQNTGCGTTASFSVSEAGYTGSFTATSTNTSLATVASTSGTPNDFTVTAVLNGNPGFGASAPNVSITVKDANNNSATEQVAFATCLP